MHSVPVRRIAAVLLTVMTLGVAIASADQSSAPKAPATTQKPTARARKQTVAAKPSPASVQTPASVQADPPLPLWPANDHPNDATIVWNSRGLRIDASNSSLQQILREVSTDIGVKITGLNGDLRVFGTYGPGAARDVLSQLLDGSGYNVLMVGELGQGTPRQVVLTKQPTGPAPPVANSPNSGNDDSSADVEEPPQPQAPPPQPPNMPSGFGPGSQPRTPQQILQEMQQRQQQIEQQQLQQQQQRANPPQ